MRIPPESLGDFRLADILSLLAVRRWRSITAAARELKVSPSQVSKSVARLERQLKVDMLVRSAHGVSLSEDGERAVPHLENVILHWRQALQSQCEPLRQLTIAAPSYMNMVFLPRIAASHPLLRLRDLEMPPPMIRAFSAQNLFEVILMLGKPTLPDSWVCTCLGAVRKALFASPKLARRLLPHPVVVDALREIPFVSPINNFNGQFVQLDDGCPLKYTDRRLGHEVTTLVLALELAASTEQLVFGPAIAAEPYVETGRLVEIGVAGWHVSEPLYLACNSDRVLSSDQRLIIDAMQRTLTEQRKAPANLAAWQVTSHISG